MPLEFHGQGGASWLPNPSKSREGCIGALRIVSLFLLGLGNPLRDWKIGSSAYVICSGLRNLICFHTELHCFPLKFFSYALSWEYTEKEHVDKGPDIWCTVRMLEGISIDNLV